MKRHAILIMATLVAVSSCSRMTHSGDPYEFIVEGKGEELGHLLIIDTKGMAYPELDLQRMSYTVKVMDSEGLATLKDNHLCEFIKRDLNDQARLKGDDGWHIDQVYTFVNTKGDVIESCEASHRSKRAFNGAFHE